MREIRKEWYVLRDTENVFTPALVCYPRLIEYNIEQAIREAGGAERVWAHVKTFKSADILRLLQKKGISRFKCATIAEAEMAAQCDAEHVLVAYPLVGPNIGRFLRLIKQYPHTVFWAIGDHDAAIAALSAAAERENVRAPLLIDVNIGMDRTGAALGDVIRLYEACLALPGVAPRGLHCFSGNFKIADWAGRKAAVEKTAAAVMALREEIRGRGRPFEALVLSGTPVLNCYREYADVYLCPGTAFITDMAYYQTFPDYDFVPAAAVLTRVISNPVPGHFTVDLGYKAIAADPKGARGVILGHEEAESLFQCEEHWTFRTRSEDAPKVGDVLYVLPTHICPTITCYPAMLTAEEGEITGSFEVTARNRSIGV